MDDKLSYSERVELLVRDGFDVDVAEQIASE